MTGMHLSHHGIEGQKWGKRNGPPYPLDYDAHSAAEKNSNPKSKLDNYSDSTKKKTNNKSSLMKESAKSARASVKNMSDSELKAAIDRKKKEKEYIELSSRDITQGRDYVEKLMVDFGTNSVNSFVKAFSGGLGGRGATALLDVLWKNIPKSEVKK